MIQGGRGQGAGGRLKRPVMAAQHGRPGHVTNCIVFHRGVPGTAWSRCPRPTAHRRAAASSTQHGACRMHAHGCPRRQLDSWAWLASCLQPRHTALRPACASACASACTHACLHACMLPARRTRTRTRTRPASHCASVSRHAPPPRPKKRHPAVALFLAQHTPTALVPQARPAPRRSLQHPFASRHPLRLLLLLLLLLRRHRRHLVHRHHHHHHHPHLFRPPAA